MSLCSITSLSVRCFAFRTTNGISRGDSFATPRDSFATPLVLFSYEYFLRFIPSQGEALIPGERAEAMERFTPADGSGVVFIKLSDGRGYVAIIRPAFYSVLRATLCCPLDRRHVFRYKITHLQRTFSEENDTRLPDYTPKTVRD